MKIKATIELPPPINIRELIGFQGRIAYIYRFIPNRSKKCEPFLKLVKKDVPFERDEDCQKAFNNIKSILD